MIANSKMAFLNLNLHVRIEHPLPPTQQHRLQQRRPGPSLLCEVPDELLLVRLLMLLK